MKARPSPFHNAPSPGLAPCKDRINRRRTEIAAGRTQHEAAANECEASLGRAREERLDVQNGRKIGAARLGSVTLIPVKLLNTQQPLKRNLISLGQSKNLFATRHIAGSLPSCERRSGNSGQFGRFLLSELCFSSEVMQPRPIRVTPCFWSSTHARLRLIWKSGRTRSLSIFRQTQICACYLRGACTNNVCRKWEKRRLSKR